MSWISPPPGPFPPGQAWYPLLGRFGPTGSIGADDFDPWQDEGQEELTPADCWKTKDGKVVPIAQLETLHLRNIIRMIERNNGGPGCLIKLQEKRPRVRNLVAEFVKRF